jgi:hypothetical protein
MMHPTPGTHDVAGNAVEMARAKVLWAQAARPLLERVASRYGEYITYGTLAKEVQELAQIWTRQLIHYWIGEVAFMAHRADEPLLSSLVVDAQHEVGSGYRSAVLSVYGNDADVEDLQMHAAMERLRCYRYFGATLPPDGGKPMLTTRVAQRRSNQAQARRAATPLRYCPNCHIQLPASGQCDMCS